MCSVSLVRSLMPEKDAALSRLRPGFKIDENPGRSIHPNLTIGANIRSVIRNDKKYVIEPKKSILTAIF